MITLTLLILSVILNVALLWGVKNLMTKLEYFEDYFEQLQQGLGHVLHQIKSVDIRGAFEADDEVGIVFKGIKGMIESLEGFLSLENES